MFRTVEINHDFTINILVELGSQCPDVLKLVTFVCSLSTRYIYKVFYVHKWWYASYKYSYDGVHGMGSPLEVFAVASDLSAVLFCSSLMSSLASSCSFSSTPLGSSFGPLAG